MGLSADLMILHISARVRRTRGLHFAIGRDLKDIFIKEVSLSQSKSQDVVAARVSLQEEMGGADRATRDSTPAAIA